MWCPAAVLTCSMRSRWLADIRTWWRNRRCVCIGSALGFHISCASSFTGAELFLSRLFVSSSCGLPMFFLYCLVVARVYLMFLLFLCVCFTFFLFACVYFIFLLFAPVYFIFLLFAPVYFFFFFAHVCFIFLLFYQLVICPCLFHLLVICPCLFHLFVCVVTS